MKVPESKRNLKTPPTLLLKAQKNDVEITKMKEALVRDAVALTDFLAFLDTEVRYEATWHVMRFVHSFLYTIK